MASMQRQRQCTDMGRTSKGHGTGSYHGRTRDFGAIFRKAGQYMVAWDFLLERIATPIGQMLLVTDNQQRLRAIDWDDHEARMHLLMQRQYRGVSIHLRETAPTSDASRAVQTYFEGELHAINALPVALGGTEFQQQVWMALRTVPCGQTISYRDFAARIGRPAAVRAVGLANGANPISLVLPCHRVIGSNGTLTGYGGGLHRKHWLLEHEQANFVR